MGNNDSKRLSELTVGDAKRILVYGTIAVLAVVLFMLLIGKVLVALLMGVVVGAYLLPVQERLEKRLRARAGSAIITIALIVVPLILLVGYTWHELYGYSKLVNEKHDEMIAAISRSLSRYLPIAREETRLGLQTAFTEGVTRSAQAIQALRRSAALLLASLAIFFFTIFYVLTQRVRLAGYIKVRIPGDYLPFYEKLTQNIGGALRGALFAVLVDQSLKGLIILTLNFVFDVPLALVLGLVSFLLGLLPPLGEWVVYLPVSAYLLVFRNEPRNAVIYLVIGIAMTVASTLVVRPRLAASSARRFGFYWMLIALVAGVYTFGIAGIVLGPAIIGFLKTVFDTLFGDVRYETSLLKSEKEQQQAKHSPEKIGERRQRA